MPEKQTKQTMIRLQTSGGRKSRLLFTLLLFMSFSSCFGEQGYAKFDSGTGTLTFYYGIPTGTYYSTDTETSNPGWYENRTKIKKVVFDSSFADARPMSCYNWFTGCTNLTDINGIEYLNTSKVTNMSFMFQGCGSLTILDLSNFDTANVTDMQSMFSRCSKLTRLTFGNDFKTANVTSMNKMFYNCSKLTELDVSKFNTEKVTDMTSMFYQCSALTSLDVSNFDTANVTTSMNQMFYKCSQLTELDVSDFDTGKVTNMGSMFSGCSQLTELDVSDFDTGKVTNMGSMFSNCSGLTSLTFGENFTAANVTNMSYMFNNCSSLTSLTFGENFTAANVTNMSYMFNNCSHLTSLDVSKFNTAKVTDMRLMFSGCSGLTSLTFGENFTTASCTKFSNMFQGCGKMRYLDFYASNDDNTHAFKEANLNRNGASYTVLFGKEDSGLPLTTVIYMPHGISKSDYTSYTDLPNLVFNDGGTLKAANYYSEDKVEIELPREFKTAKAEYSRTMSNNYGSVVLPYDFTTDANIQAYTLDEEHTETMYFKNVTTVAAHTPFAFKKLQSGNTADFVMTDEGFGITVEATHTTSAKEGGVPFTHNENLGGWTTKGYYINETVADYDGAFYIAGDKFYKASAPLTLYPHRVTFHGAWTKSGTSGEAQFYNINTVSDSETITAIEAADLRHTRSVAAEVYDVAGRRLPEMVKGLNIVRMNDGSVRKVNIR